jgi:glutathione S-transferase
MMQDMETRHSSSTTTSSVVRLRTPTVVLCEMDETPVPNLESFSPFCLKIHRALKLAGISYTSRRGAPRDFRSLNPAGQLPVLIVDGEPIADSTRIMRKIVELAPKEAALEPSDARMRGEAWLWEDWADRAMNGWLVAARWADNSNWTDVREAYFGKAPWFVRKIIVPRLRSHVIRTLVARDVIRGGMEAMREDFRAILDHLEARSPLKGFWLGTQDPTLCDVAIFAQVHSLRTKLTPGQAREVAMRPALTDWLDRVDESTRSSYAAFRQPLERLPMIA